MRRIVMPQALRFAIPPMGNDFIAMTKDSAMVAATGFVHEVDVEGHPPGTRQLPQPRSAHHGRHFLLGDDPHS